MSTQSTVQKIRADLMTPTDLDSKATEKIAAALNVLVADAFSLYVKTKNFHWHMTGPHFRDYHLMLDEQSDQIFATTDPLAERVRKLGRSTIRSISEIASLRTIKDSSDEPIEPLAMLRELVENNKAMAHSMRKAHALCDQHGDIATASLLEVYVDETERRTWFLFEASRAADTSGH